MSMFARYKEVERKTGAILSMDWRLMSGGYLHIGENNWTFAHRLFVKGSPVFGTEKEFIFRVQLALDFETRFSWITLELVNFFDARWVYFWLKVWKNRNLKFIFNLGWRLTSASRKYIENQIADHERRNYQEMRKRIREVQMAPNGTPIKKEVI